MTRGQADYRLITAVMSNARPIGSTWSIQPACRRCSGVAVLPLLGTLLDSPSSTSTSQFVIVPPARPLKNEHGREQCRDDFWCSRSNNMPSRRCLATLIGRGRSRAARRPCSAAAQLAQSAQPTGRDRRARRFRRGRGTVHGRARRSEHEHADAGRRWGACFVGVLSAPHQNDTTPPSKIPSDISFHYQEPDEIFYGSEMTEEEFVENYRYLVNIGNKDSPQCGASVISPRALLSAAHCFIDYTDGSYDAYIIDFIEVNRYDVSVDNGAGGKPVERRYLDRVFQDSETTVGKARVRSGFSFQDYIDRTGNDFALVILEDPLPDYITPVKLNSDDSVPTPGVDLQTMGWGLTEEDTYPDRPRIVTIPAISNEQCEELTFGDVYIPDNMVCTFDDEGPPERDACGGNFAANVETFSFNQATLTFASRYFTSTSIQVTRVALLFTTMAKGTSKLVLLAGALRLAKKNQEYHLFAFVTYAKIAPLFQGYDWIVSTVCHYTNGEASFCKSSKSSKSAKKSAPSWENCLGDL
ncbi:hypothetical protein THAOC_13494 [Thalassiosira oceanica]|uniref:Peptidase S1 domain-containing protein n=1 Tax=Thalassiosira oceanica TaxID=159749 RepID=K0SXC2_THAOC|nr:hypothetical protein THAOC_13494 [Thalassiosira oceanica]|eukprot:EJK65626.1 hypothetical protein THAOC_13494 [Thalassiosira oceanica]